jgi:DNA invertase Pin-like site-specific DNA recombinase
MNAPRTEAEAKEKTAVSVAAKTSQGYRPAVGYLRRSTDRQEQSIGDQRKAIERYAEENGFDVLDFYVDDAISGTTTDERKAFLRLIEDAGAEGCPFRYVLVYDIKRFGRLDNDEAGYYRFQLRRNGIEVVYVSEGFNGDDSDDLLRPVKQWQARQESKELSKVTIRGLLSRSGEGWWSGGQPPYGYDLVYWSADGRFLMTVRYDAELSKQILDGDGNVVRVVPRGESLTFSKRDRCKLVPSTPERVQVVRSIFSWYVTQGLGFKGIADRLNREGVPSPRGGKWSQKHRDKWAMTTIRDMLTNPAYVGDFVWNRHSFAKFHRIEKGRAVPRKGIPGPGPERNRPDDWVVTKDAHPALISRTLFQAARSKRESRRRDPSQYSYRTGHGAHSPFLLTGLITCQRCGHTWQGYTTHKGRKRTDGTSVKTLGYACGGYVTKGKSCCTRLVLPKEEIEEWVFEQIARIVRSYLEAGAQEKLCEMIEQEVAGGDRFDESELAAVRQGRADIETKIENLLDNITPINRDYVDRRIAKLRDEMVQLQQQEEALMEQQGRECQAAELAQAALALAPQVNQVARFGTVDEKRTFIRAFLREVEFDPESRTGTAYFYAVPSPTRDSGPEPSGGTRYQPATTDSAPEGSGLASDEKSSLRLRDVGARYAQKRTAPEGGDSSLIMVAGAGFLRNLPVAPEVTFQLPVLRGVRGEDFVPAVLDSLVYVSCRVGRTERGDSTGPDLRATGPG